MKKAYKSYYRTKLSFWNTIKTEWNSIKADKAVIVTFSMVTLVLLFIYTYIYSNEVVKDVPIAVINQDASKLSRDYISMLDASDGLKTITNYTDIQQAKQDYYAKKVLGIIIIPQNFSKDIHKGIQSSVITYIDASNMIFYKTILGDVSIINNYFNAGISIKKSMSNDISLKKAQQNYTPIKAVSKSLFNISSGYATYIIPIITALIIQIVILMGIGLLNGTRNEKQLFRTNFPRLLHIGGTIPVLLGKAVLYTTLFSILLIIQVGIIYTIFSIPVRTSIFIIYLFVIPYFFSVVFLGIAISSFFKKREDSIMFLVLTSIPSLMLSGLSFPKESFPFFYQYFMQLIPSTPGINGFVKLTQMKTPFSEVYNEWIHLWALALIYFIIASITLKYRASKEYKYLIA